MKLWGRKGGYDRNKYAYFIFLVGIILICMWCKKIIKITTVFQALNTQAVAKAHK